MEIRLWVCNQSEAGADDDHTYGHLVDVGWKGTETVHVPSEPEALRKWFDNTFVPLQESIRHAGWGEEIDCTIKPLLTAFRVDGGDEHDRALAECYSIACDAASWIEIVTGESVA